MEIKILGTNCARCLRLEEMSRLIVDEENLDITVIKESDVQKIIGYGIMSTPGFVFNEKVIMNGQFPKKEELREMILGLVKEVTK